MMAIVAPELLIRFAQVIRPCGIHMKITKTISTLGVCALLSLNSAAFAQGGTGNTGSDATSGTTGNTTGGATDGSTTGGSTMATDTTGDRQERNDDTDYGWLGLLGLAGLAGLMKKPRQEVVHQTDVRTNTPNR
jgi:hypothetical protein